MSVLPAQRHAQPQDPRVRAEACHEALRDGEAACCLPVPGSGLAAAATATVVTRRARLTRRCIFRPLDQRLGQNETA